MILDEKTRSDLTPLIAFSNKHETNYQLSLSIKSDYLT